MMAGYEAVSGCTHESGAALIHSPTPGSPHILVVEHDQSVAELLFAFLKGEGYELSLASSPEQALERMNEQTFHLVLTDLFAAPPRRSFAQVRRLLRHSLLTPVGLMTGWQVSLEAARRQGFAFLLQKPFDLDLLLAEIETCLHQTLTPQQEQQFHAIERFMEAMKTRNRETLRQLITEDITYYPPLRTLASRAIRVRGLAAIIAYVQESQTRYQDVSFDEVLFYPRPKGWAMRYSSHWTIPDGTRHNLAGVLLFHFRGEQIHRIGIQWNDQRLYPLLGEPQG